MEGVAKRRVVLGLPQAYYVLRRLWHTTTFLGAALVAVQVVHG